MVQGDIRNQAGVGLDGVNGIQAATHTHFQYQRIRTRVRKSDQRRQRAEFEIGQRHVHAGSLHTFEGSYDRRTAGRVAVDTNSFMVAQHMRRCVASRFVSGICKKRLEHRNARALAVGACNVNDKTWSRQRQDFKHGFDALQPKYYFTG
jgi:hypothetical protein